jgi:Acetyltransferase (GNAT) family
MSGAVQLRELTTDVDDQVRLAAFYKDVYEKEFPDSDERESLANITEYLALKAKGWYGRNGYHVIVAYREDTIVGGCILDYLTRASGGVIEFLFTVTAARGGGVGGALLKEAERLLALDAQGAGNRLEWIAAEMNDPFVVPEVPDNMDPFLRARIWDAWGFGALDCPYVQPALSEQQRPAQGLLLIAKLFEPSWNSAVPSCRVRELVAEYLRWAMRIATPQENPEFRRLAQWLEARVGVGWVRLAQYIGEYSEPTFDVVELRSARDPEFAASIEVYRRAFDSPATSVEPASFVRGLARYAESGYRYHLWAVRRRDDGQVSGMTSFFTFERVGFGGYVVLEGTLRDVGCLRPLLARMEQQMLADGFDARGWLIECETVDTVEIFRRCGFYVVDVGYRQPDLPGAATRGGLSLILMYRAFGRVYEKPHLSADDLLTGLSALLRYVYRIRDPATHPTYRAVAARVAGGTVSMIDHPTAVQLAALSGSSARQVPR